MHKRKFNPPMAQGRSPIVQAVRLARTRSQVADRRSHIGFTLVEVLVVVGIIVLLAAIGLVAGPAVLGLGKEKQTHATLLTAQTLLNEYLQLTNQQQVISGTDPNDYKYTVPSINVLVNRAEKNQQLKDILGTFDDGVLVKEGSVWKLYDSWKREIVFNPSGEEDGLKKDPTFGSFDKMPDRNRPYFISRGPDGELGRWDNGTSGSPQDEPATSGARWDEDNDKTPDAADNLFSYDLR